MLPPQITPELGLMVYDLLLGQKSYRSHFTSCSPTVLTQGLLDDEAKHPLKTCHLIRNELLPQWFDSRTAIIPMTILTP
jgi:hypothetical protein